MFWSAGRSFLRAEGFSCSLCVLYGGPGITKLQFFIKKISSSFSAVNFFPIFSHQHLGFRTESGSATRKNAGSGSALNQCGSTTLPEMAPKSLDSLSHWFCLLIVSVSGHIESVHYQDRFWPLIVLGSLMFIPGSYHTYFAYKVFPHRIIVRDGLKRLYIYYQFPYQAPDPALFVSDLQDANKILFFSQSFYAYSFLKLHLHHSWR
jgi:hypothetical protein